MFIVHNKTALPRTQSIRPIIGQGKETAGNVAVEDQNERPLAKLMATVLALTLVLSCLSFFAAGPNRSVAYGAPLTEVVLVVQQNFSAGGNTAPLGTTFSYQLTPELAGSPMPASGGTFSITGTGTANLTLSFADTGIYTYTLSHVTPWSTGYTHDNQVYTLEIYVYNNGTSAVVIYNQGGSKVAGIVYNQSFYSFVAPPTDPPPVVPQPGQPPVVITVPGEERVIVVETEVPRTDPPPTPPTTVIKDEEVPLDQGTPAWALINLILAVIGIILAIVTVIRALRGNKNEEEDEDEYPELYYRDAHSNIYPVALIKQLAKSEDDEQDEEDDKVRKTRRIWLIATIALAIIGIVFFFLTEDIRLPMILVDRWTIVNAIILLVEIVAMVLVFKKVDENVEEDEEDYLLADA